MARVARSGKVREWQSHGESEGYSETMCIYSCMVYCILVYIIAIYIYTHYIIYIYIIYIYIYRICSCTATASKSSCSQPSCAALPLVCSPKPRDHGRRKWCTSHQPSWNLLSQKKSFLEWGYPNSWMVHREILLKWMIWVQYKFTDIQSNLLADLG